MTHLKINYSALQQRSMAEVVQAKTPASLNYDFTIILFTEKRSGQSS